MQVNCELTELALEHARQKKMKVSRSVKCNKKLPQDMEAVGGKPGKEYPREGASELLMADAKEDEMFSLFLFPTVKISGIVK